MMGDPRATFYYPHELRRIRRSGFIAGLVVGALAGVIVFSVWLL